MFFDNFRKWLNEAIQSVRYGKRPKQQPARRGVRLFAEILEDRMAPAVNIGAVNTDALVIDVDGDGVADPGDTLQYAVTITNSGTTAATGVSFSDTEDANTMLVGGSIKITPIAFDDGPYALTGNTPITIAAGAGLLANDIDPDASTPLTNIGLTAVGLNTTGTQGSVVLNTDGSFTFTPTTGFTGLTTFQYTARDADSLDSVVTGTVTMNVTGLIWYVDSAAAGGGDGSFNAPFTTLSPLSTGGDPDGAGNTIFVYESGSTYTGGIELENTQLLIGESVGLGVVNGMTIGGSGGNPTIATGAAANDVTLASGNTVRGFTLGNSSGSALAGTSFGTLTINTVTINTSGQTLNLNTGAFAAGAAFTSITSTGGTNNVSLTSITGTVDLGSGALSGATGTAFLVSGGTVSSTYSGNISKSSAGLLIDIDNHETGTVTFQTGTLSSTGTSSGLRVQNSNSGTVNFNNPTKTLNTGANSAVTLNTNNAGGTMNFGGGGLDIDTTTATGFSATGGGTVNVTGTGNTITTTAGAAINVANTTIGASGVTFQSISSSGAADGIVLNNTGNGFFTVTGDGTTTRNNSGGTINSSGTAISLTDVANVQLDHMAITGAGDDGVFGTLLTDEDGAGGKPSFAYRHGSITNQGNAVGDHAFDFETLSAANVTGSFVVDNVLVQNFGAGAVSVSNNSGTLAASVLNSIIDNNDDTIGETAIEFRGTGTAIINSTVQNNDLTDVEGGISIVNEGNQTNDTNVINNRVSRLGGPDSFPTGPGININVQPNASVTFDVQGNAVRHVGGDGFVLVAFGSTEGRVGGSGAGQGNTFANLRTGDGVRIDVGDSTDTNPALTGKTYTILVENNDIGVDNTGLPTPPATSPVNPPGVGDDGIQILHRNTGSTLNLTILNNRINQTVSEGIRYFTDQDTATAVTSVTNLRIENNVLTNIDTDNNENEIELISSANAAAGSTQTSYIITGNNNGTAGTFGTINISTATNSTSSITQASTAALGTANDNATVTGSPTTFNSGAANPPLPSNPLILAPGGVSSAAPTTSDTPGASDVTALGEGLPTPPAPPTAGLPAPSTASAPAAAFGPATVVDDGVLSASELDFIVQSAISRWSATGLTAEQLAALNAVTFEVTPMNGWYLGSAAGNLVQIDSDAGGFGWFVDPTPQDDTEFPNAATATRLYTDPTLAPAGHIDLLTTVMHELGHVLGVDDRYDSASRDSLMYGYATVGERRLPAAGQAAGATPGSIDHEEYLIGPLNLGTLPAGKSVQVTFRTTINSLTNGLAPTISNQGTVSGSNFANVLTDDPAAGGAADPTTTTLDSMTLGNQVWIEANSNSVFNSGTDTNVNNAALTLFLSDGTTQVTTGSTNASGVYQFTGLLPGDYIVRVNASNFGAGQPLDGRVSITGSADPDDNVDNDDNGVDNAAPATNGIRSLPITLAYNTEPTAGTGNDNNNTLDFGFTVGPPVTAVKVDSLATDVDGDGVADPGDTLQYTVTITNNTAGNLTGMNFSDNEDPNTMLVPGSIRITPIAFDDAYNANTGSTLTVSTAASGILGNDVDPTVGSGAAFLDVTGAPVRDAGASTAGAGTLNVTLADGTFTYTPHASATAGQKEVFTYNIVDAEALNAIVSPA